MNHKYCILRDNTGYYIVKSLPKANGMIYYISEHSYYGKYNSNYEDIQLNHAKDTSKQGILLEEYYQRLELLDPKFIECECGSKIRSTRDIYQKHLRTKKHLSFIG